MNEIPTIILACGDSLRFKDYDRPKQFLTFAMHPEPPAQMWQNVLVGMKCERRVILAVRKDHSQFLTEPSEKCQICWMPPTGGQADTLYRAINMWRDTDIIASRHRAWNDAIVVNCDQGFAPGVLDRLVEVGRREGLPAAVTFHATVDEEHRWSYIDHHPKFNYAAEKKAISIHALGGAYYFHDVDLLDYYLERAVQLAEGDDREAYLSEVYDHFGMMKVSVEVRRDDIYDWGTPEAFRRFSEPDTDA